MSFYNRGRGADHRIGYLKLMSGTIALLNTKLWIKLSRIYFPTDSSFRPYWAKTVRDKIFSFHIWTNYRILDLYRKIQYPGLGCDRDILHIFYIYGCINLQTYLHQSVCLEIDILHIVHFTINLCTMFFTKPSSLSLNHTCERWSTPGDCWVSSTSHLLRITKHECALLHISSILRTLRLQRS